MSRILLVIFSFFSLNTYSSDFNIYSSDPYKITDKNAIPIELIHADESDLIYSKGTSSNEVKSIDILNHEYRLVKNIKLPTLPVNRVDHIIWTGEQLVVLWEKKIKNDRALSIQAYAKNGRAAAKNNLGNLENCFSPLLQDHQVDIVSSPGNEYFAFIVNDIYIKLKDTIQKEMIAVFDKKGKLFYSKKNTFNISKSEDGFYFLSDNGDFIKMVSYSTQSIIKAFRRNVAEKTEDTIRFDLNLPEGVYVASYRIHFNPVKNQFDYIATTKTHPDLNGHNGEFYAKFDLGNTKPANKKYAFYDLDFLSEFEKTTSYRTGNIILKDLSLSNHFKIRKPVYKNDGGYYLIKEYSAHLTSDFEKGSSPKVDQVSKNKSCFNPQYKIKEAINILDFVVTSVDQYGNIEWIRRIPKSQIAPRQEYGNFDAFTYNNDLYIVYNESKSNVRKAFDQELNTIHLLSGNVIPVIRKVDLQGNISNFDLSAALGNKMLFIPAFSFTYPNPAGCFVSYIKEKSNSAGATGKFIQLSVGEFQEGDETDIPEDGEG